LTTWQSSSYCALAVVYICLVRVLLETLSTNYIRFNLSLIKYY
jgi:hypothetical protein